MHKQLELDLENRVHDSLPAAKQRRFRWLVAARNHAAQTIAEMVCWGLYEAPGGLDRQVATIEAAIEGLIPDPTLASELLVEYAVYDSTLIHARGESPTGLDCAVCRSGGRYGIEDVLARIPDLDE